MPLLLEREGFDLREPKELTKFQIWLRECRDSANLTQEELGELIGRKKQTVSIYEGGTKRNDASSIPPHDILLKIIAEFQKRGVMATIEDAYRELGYDSPGKDSLFETLSRLGKAFSDNSRVVVGRVPCSDADLRFQEDIGPILAYYNADFALIAQGDSMEPHIHDGDMLYIRRTSEPQIGKVVIALVYGESVAKKLTAIKVDQETGDIIYTLSPTNHKYREIKAHDVQFQGVVVGKGMRF